MGWYEGKTQVKTDVMVSIKQGGHRLFIHNRSLDSRQVENFKYIGLLSAMRKGVMLGLKVG